jgi:putative transposase
VDGTDELPENVGFQRHLRAQLSADSNAPIESFWGTLKSELVYHRRFATRQQAQQEITEYIEIFYNRQRTQARLDYLSPVAFSQRFNLNKIAA